MNEIQNLLAQVRILEQQAANKTGVERQELQKAAARVKMQIIKLLPERGQQQQESKVPDPNEYFGAKLPDGFEDYFPGSYINPEIEDYFNNLTPDMRDYFKVEVPENAPDAPKKEPDKTKVFDDWEYRRKVFNALGIPC
ncbi:hypothetical protein ACJEOV_001809 [Escherichia coli]|uniref:hypothetical protein n=1 Tax=Escherichia coli TaxID=562 RepID=UPI0010BC82B4|nr:hypothetical protein [Escherichia coli]GCK36525.1 hypothetical protein BvCmsB39A_03828 [Escherichia coli]